MGGGETIEYCIYAVRCLRYAEKEGYAVGTKYGIVYVFDYCVSFGEQLQSLPCGCQAGKRFYWCLKPAI